MKVPVMRKGEEVWVEGYAPGDRFRFKPIGRPDHWHVMVRVEYPGGDALPTFWDRCLWKKPCP
jgi:hypothetical protein